MSILRIYVSWYLEFAIYIRVCLSRSLRLYRAFFVARMTNRHTGWAGLVLAWCRRVEKTQQLLIVLLKAWNMWLKWQQWDGCFWSRQSYRYPNEKWYCLDGGPSQGWVSAVHSRKILFNCWRLAFRIDKDGTTKKWGNKETKNEKTEVVQKNGESEEQLERSSK